jgi:hypothetical protein
VCAAEIEVHARRPNLDFVIVEIRRAVGVIIIVLDDETDFLVGLVVVERGYRFVNLFSNLCHNSAGSLCTFVEVNEKVICLERFPLKFGMVDFLGVEGRQEEKGEWKKE